MKVKVIVLIVFMVLGALTGNLLSNHLGWGNAGMWTTIGMLIPIVYVFIIIFSLNIDEDLAIFIGVGLVMYGLVKLIDLLWPGQPIEFLFVVGIIGYFVGGVACGAVMYSVRELFLGRTL